MSSLLHAIACISLSGTSHSLFACTGQAGAPQAPHSIPRQAAATPARTYPGAWVAAAVANLRQPRGSSDTGSTGVSFSPEDELPIVAALEKALGVPVKAVQGTSATPSGFRGLVLRLSMDSKSAASWWLGMLLEGLVLPCWLRNQPVWCYG